jgi:hypothetical protein
MTDGLRKVYPEVALWAVFTLASAIFFAFAHATSLQPLANGLLVTSVALLVTTTLFEVAWQAIAGVLGGRGVERRRR